MIGQQHILYTGKMGWSINVALFRNWVSSCCLCHFPIKSCFRPTATTWVELHWHSREKWSPNQTSIVILSLGQKQKMLCNSLVKEKWENPASFAPYTQGYSTKQTRKAGRQYPAGSQLCPIIALCLDSWLICEDRKGNSTNCTHIFIKRNTIRVIRAPSHEEFVEQVYTLWGHLTIPVCIHLDQIKNNQLINQNHSYFPFSRRHQDTLEWVCVICL